MKIMMVTNAVKDVVAAGGFIILLVGASVKLSHFSFS